MVIVPPKKFILGISIRGHFLVPYPVTLILAHVNIFLDTTQEVEDKLRNRTVCLSIDGWEDPQHFHVLGVTARTMIYGAQPLLIQYDRQHERQTAAVVADAILAAQEYIQGIGGSVLAVTTDNAANMRAACSKISDIIWLGCQAHTGELPSRSTSWTTNSTSPARTARRWRLSLLPVSPSSLQCGRAQRIYWTPV